MTLHETRLLFRRQDHHAVLIIGITERGENLSADPEIGMAHVCACFSLGQAQSDTAKLGSGHGLGRIGT